MLGHSGHTGQGGRQKVLQGGIFNGSWKKRAKIITNTLKCHLVTLHVACQQIGPWFQRAGPQIRVINLILIARQLHKKGCLMLSPSLTPHPLEEQPSLVPQAWLCQAPNEAPPGSRPPSEVRAYVLKQIINPLLARGVAKKRIWDRQLMLAGKTCAPSTVWCNVWLTGIFSQGPPTGGHGPRLWSQ